MRGTQNSAEHNVNSHVFVLTIEEGTISTQVKKDNHYGITAALKFCTTESSLTQDPDVVIYPEHGPLFVPTINHFAGREGDPHMEQSGNT